MNIRIADLKNKQVVCIKNGGVLGFIYDVELDTESGRLTAVIIPGRPRFFGILGHDEDIVIPWSDIEVMGQETVLVKTDLVPYARNAKRRFFDG